MAKQLEQLISENQLLIEQKATLESELAGLEEKVKASRDLAQQVESLTAENKQSSESNREIQSRLVEIQEMTKFMERIELEQKT